MAEKTKKLKLGELKCQRQEMREKFSQEGWTPEEGEEYREVVRKLRWVESIVLWTLVGIISLMSGFGCQTMKGIAGDSGWMLTKLADNIQTQEK